MILNKSGIILVSFWLLTDTTLVAILLASPTRRMPMATDKIEFTLRLREETSNKLTEIANRNLRSRNAQIATILEQFVQEYEQAHGKIKLEY
jgi:hypothetical protein